MIDHHPPHIYNDDTWYMVTASTRDHAHFLAGEHAKAVVRDTLRTVTTRLGLTLQAWVILDNHYHLLLRTNHGRDLSLFVAQLNGATTRLLNLNESTPGRHIWHNYWDSCVRTEADFWTRFNYIHQNPIKHGYVQRLEDWPFSSYSYYLRTRGTEWLQDCWLRYPVIDFIEGDNFAPTA